MTKKNFFLRFYSLGSQKSYGLSFSQQIPGVRRFQGDILVLLHRPRPFYPCWAAPFSALTSHSKVCAFFLQLLLPGEAVMRPILRTRAHQGPALPPALLPPQVSTSESPPPHLTLPWSLLFKGLGRGWEVGCRNFL